MQSTAACQELLTLQQSTKITINNKKQDWLKIKVNLLSKLVHVCVDLLLKNYLISYFIFFRVLMSSYI